ALGRGRGGQPQDRRRARDRQRRSLRRGMARAHPPLRPVGGRFAPRRGGLQAPPRRAVTRFLSLTDADREEMLETIGVPGLEDLFEQIPRGVRFDRELALEPALSEPELVAHLEALAARNAHTGVELSFLGAGIYDHYVPAVVDAVLDRK